MFNFRRIALLTGVFFAGGSLLAEPVDWPQFRGPNTAGVAEDARPPVEFGPEHNVLWKTELPPGVSSPVLTESLIFLTAAEDAKLITLAIDRASGKVLWRRTIPQPRDERKHQLNNSASSTPATDGENVYVFFGDFGLVSYDADGGERWRLPLGPFQNLHGMAASPVLAGGKLIMLCDQDVDAYLLALDKDTGKQIWKTPRPEVVHGFSTPTLFQPADDVEQLIVPGSYQLTSYSAADGKKLWWVRGVTWQTKPAAVVDAAMVYMSAWAPGADAGERRVVPPFDEVIGPADADGNGMLSQEEVPEKMKPTGSWRAIDLDQDGFMNGREWNFYRARLASRNVTLAVRPEARRGDLTDTGVVWDYEKVVPVVSTPLLYAGSLLTIKDGGILTAFNAATGEVIHQGRLSGAIDKYYSSPVAANGKIYLASEEGKVSVLEAKDGYPTLALNELNESCYATPAIAGDTLYIRTDSALYAFREE